MKSQLFRKKLERNKAAEFGVLGLVHNTHATTTQLLDDAVARDGLAYHWDETGLFLRPLYGRGIPESTKNEAGSRPRLRWSRETPSSKSMYLMLVQISL